MFAVVFAFESATQLSWTAENDCTLVGTVDGGGEFVVSEDPSVSYDNSLAPSSVAEGVGRKFIYFHKLDAASRILNFPILQGRTIFVAISAVDPPINHILLFEAT